MEMLQSIVVMESVVLGLILCAAAGYFYLQSHRLTDTRVFGLLSILFTFCLPGMIGAVSPSLLRIVIPLGQPQAMVPLALSLPVMILCILFGVSVRFARTSRANPKKEIAIARQVRLRYRPGRLFFLSLAFFLVGLVGEYKELHAVGGWLGVIRGGGAAYVQARVTQTVGFWGVLVAVIPIAAIGMMYSVSIARAVPRQLRWLLVVLILCTAIGMISLLTTRHQSVMLLLSVIALLEVRTRRVIRVLAPLALVLIAVGAVALASFRYSSTTANIDQLAGNFEHIEISERIISTVHISGYIWGGNIPEFFTMFIPRVLWPNKPMGNPINQVVFWEFAKLGGVKTVGLLGEAYASGGLPFVALEGLLYGIMLRRVRGFWDRRRANVYQFMAYGSVILGYIYLAAQSGFVTLSVTTFLVMVVQVRITMWLAGYIPGPAVTRSPASVLVENRVPARATTL